MLCCFLHSLVFCVAEIEIGFSRDEFPVMENGGVALVKVEVKRGIANRSFTFHVETFEQQAREGRYLNCSFSSENAIYT